MCEKIAIYDVRGIQSYIFRTNAVKEIIGASEMVSNLIMTGLKYAIKKKGLSENEAIVDWKEQSEFRFEKNNNIKLEVLYYGGGNLVVLYRDEELCKEISVSMSKYVMKNAYGLSLVYACVDKKEKYQENWKELKEKLSEIKAVTPFNTPAGINPIVQYDRLTGNPLSEIYDNKRVTLEAYQKLKKYKELEENKDKKDNYIKEFDKMRTSSGEGLIAIVHIDGNSVGMNIKEIIQNTTQYDKAVEKMRKISKNIREVFEEKAIKVVEQEIPRICKLHNVEIKENKLPFRPLIKAGDDITFVCNARIALDVVEEYIKVIKANYMYDEKFKFSACAGIAIIHSHYPFYKGYKIAEECCKSAKIRAKSEGMVEGKAENFVDFEYCYSGKVRDLDESRKEDYTTIEEKNLLKRPYGIYEDNQDLNNEQKEFSLKTFKEELKMFNGISRNVAKLFRDTYYESETSIKTALKKHTIPETAFIKINDAECAKYFDALEMLDIFGTKEEANEQETND